MKIIVIGCGKVGTTILARLVEEGHDVTAMDAAPSVIREITDIYDAMAVCGSGTDCDALSEAGVEKAEVVIAATDSDEKNMLACFLAKKMGAVHTIARIRNPGYKERGLGFMRHHLDLDLVINPELHAATELAHALQLPAAAKLESFSRRRLEMVEMRLKPDSPLVGMSLLDLRKKYDAAFLVGVIQRGERVFIPGGGECLCAGDRIGLTAAPQELQKLLKMLVPDSKQTRDVLILGASRTAYYLAKRLLAAGCRVKIIDRDEARCGEFAEMLPKAVLICGDGSRQELLLEEGLTGVDALVTLTGLDEQNILVAMFAASKKVPKVAAKISRAELLPMAQNLGLDSIVSPRSTVADSVLQYIRALENSMGSSVETLYKLMDEQVEALEFTVRPDFRHVQIPLREMPLKDGILLAGLLRGRKTILPTGDDVLLAGDQVVVLAAGQRLQDLSDIIR